MKRGLLKLGVLTSVFLLVLSGCGAQEVPAVDGVADVVTLQVYQIGDAPQNLEALTQAINEISEKEIGVKVKFNYIGWGDYEQKMSVMVTAGDEFDIAFASNYTINAQKGAYADLTELVAKYAQNYFDSIDPAYYEGNLVNGKLYAFPVSGNVFAEQMLSFNGELLDKYNIDISQIKTYADAETALQTIKDNEPEVVPFAIGSTFRANFGDVDYILGDALPFAVVATDETPQMINPFTSEVAVQRLNELHALYTKGLIPPDAATSYTSYDLNTNTWFMRQETQGPADLGDNLLSQIAGKKVVSVPLNQPLKSTAQAQMANFIVGQNSKYKEEAVKWLALLNTNAEMANTLVYGLEGEAWEPIGEHHLKFLPGYKDGYHMATWNTANQQILRQPESVTDEMLAQAEAESKSALVSPILGFNFDTDTVKTEISNIMNIMDEYGSVLNTGTVDPNVTLPQFEIKLKEAGWEQVQAEMQRQYEAFRASRNQ